jgi:PAS domain S-box-containing protein
MGQACGERGRNIALPVAKFMMPNPIKILLIEDDLSFIQHVRRLLADTRATQTHVPAYEVLHSDRMATAVAYLKTISFDVVLLGVGLEDGAKRLAEIQATDCTDAVIVVGEAADDGRWAIRQGAQDFLARPSLTQSLLNRAIGLALERKRLAAAVPYQELVDNNADGIVVVSKQGVVLYANPAAAHILQQEAAALVGETFSLPLPRKDTAEFNITRDDEQATVIEMRLKETDWHGERVYQASLRDITSHQRAKTAMRQKAAELEVRNIALDEFAHTMAHQVQGLLSQMVGYASYLEMQYGRELDDQFRTAIARIVQSGHKMNNVVSELLLLASIRGGDVAIEPLNMQRVVAEVLKRLRYQIEQSKVEIYLPESWPVASGYGSWIEEAWVNYISNGIKYGGDPPRLELGSTRMPDGMIRFWVRDNGIGIPEIDQKQLFRPHTRLGPKQVRGEGLGLSIVRRVVARCGGQVGVESHEGEGSLFWFSLPPADGIDTAVTNQT